MADKHPQRQHGVELDQDQFCCSVCLDLLKDPVTINCGHSYCRSCIEGYWEHENQRAGYSCPLCRETFSPRPFLNRNNMLAQVVEKLKVSSTHQAAPYAALPCAGPSDVACDFCCGTKPKKATMSCQTCLVSYCPSHLEPHYTVPVLKTHQLISATVSLQDKMCAKHNKLMDLYCQTDKQLVCSLCTTEEHQDHKLVSVLVQKTETEKCLIQSQKKVQEKSQQREKELMELIEAEKNLKCCAQTAVKDCDKIFAKLISSLKKRRDEVRLMIEGQEKTAGAQAEAMRLLLEKDVAKLKRRDAELERLSHADDHIHMIQIFQSLSTSCDFPDISPGAIPLRSFRDATKCVSDLRVKLEVTLEEAWPRIPVTVSYVDFSLPPAPKTREEFLRYCCPLSLDVTSNYAYLHLMGEKRLMKPTPTPYSAQPERFTDFRQVLCKEGLTWRCYWEVEWYARSLSAAVAYKDISRTSNDSRFGNNDKSWSLECTADGYLFRHNNVETTVPGPVSYKIGVFLDYQTGTLSFYQVSDQMHLLHTVHTTFTQPLYPGLGLNYEWYDVGVFAQLVKLW